MKPNRARIRRRQEDGTVLETIVAFPSIEKALEFFNEFRRRYGVTIDRPDTTFDAVMRRAKENQKSRRA